MALSDFVILSISLSRQPLTRQGFGTALILAADCPGGFTQRTRIYTSLAGLVSDGFSVSGPTYLLASVLLAQDIPPPSFKVGRLANLPTQNHRFTPVVANNTVYSGKLNGMAWSYTSGGSANAAAIVAGLDTAIAAAASVQSRSFTFTQNSTTLDVTASVAGQFDSFSVDNIDQMSVAQTHSDPGVATDLAAILTADSNWFAILNAFNSKPMALAIAAWAETQGGLKMFIADSNDSVIANTVQSGASDLAASVQSSNYNYTAVFYSAATGDFLGAADAGNCLPRDAGSENWAMQDPVVNPVSLTATDRANCIAKYATICEVVGGENNTSEGRVGSGQFIDTIRFRAWLQVNIQTNVLQAIKAQAPGKLPMTDVGANVIRAAILGTLHQGEKAGGLVEGSSSVFVPLIANVPSSDRANRLLSGVTFTAQLAGAINKASITGQLTS